MFMNETQAVSTYSQIGCCCACKTGVVSTGARPGSPRTGLRSMGWEAQRRDLHWFLPAGRMQISPLRRTKRPASVETTPIGLILSVDQPRSLRDSVYETRFVYWVTLYVAE